MRNIIEIQSIREVIPYLNPDTHLFLDLDNTLLTSVSEFGSDRWERFMVEQFIQNGFSEEEAADRACQIWKAVQTVSEIQFVEEVTEEILKSLKNPLFAITARDFDFCSVTESQLDFLDVQFSKCKVDHPVYSRGVFYCGPTPKAQVLQWYLSHHPGAHIVLVDDYRSHLETAAELLGPAFLGLRYSFLDTRKAQYTPCEATKLLGKVFSHQKAVQHLRDGLV